MSDPIDRIVKGAPPPDVSAEQLAANARASSPSKRNSVTAPIPREVQQQTYSSDPRDALPSSPPQIYLNLLILESSLRLQYISLRTRLRLHLLLFIGLVAWTVTFTYLLFFRPREDGSGVGGSVYWVLETGEKMGWCSGCVTLLLFWGTGMYERGVRWPRKFIGTTNRGLRGFNLKVVVVRGGLLREMVSWLALLDPAGWFREERVNFQIVPRDIESLAGNGTSHWNAHAAKHGLLEEDIAPAGDVLRVLLLPKPFSPDFREGWDTFRLEYWERENGRRSQLRSVVRARKREVAKREGGWFWWTGWRGWQNVTMNPFSRRKTRRQLELERLSLREKVATDALKARVGTGERRRKESLLSGRPASRSGSHSRNTSRASTPGPDGESRPSTATKEGRTRRGSSASSAGGRRPRKLASLNEPSRLSATETLLYDDQGRNLLQENQGRPLPSARPTMRGSSKRDSTISTGSSDLESRDNSFDVRSAETAATTHSPRQAAKGPIFAEDIKQEPEEE
ncbi:putative sporulation-specific protein Spo7 [Septoria linicola]|nr:putative sporulation-specific protein Spo7 [Septoria linicola]